MEVPSCLKLVGIQGRIDPGWRRPPVIQHVSIDVWELALGQQVHFPPLHRKTPDEKC